MSGAKLFATRFALALVMAVGTAFMVAVALGITDLYLTGHSQPSLGRAWIEIPSSGVFMSRSDVILWAAVFGAAGLTWWGSGRILRNQG